MIPRERGFGIAGQGDDFNGKALQSGDQIDELVGFSRVAQGQDEVATAVLPPLSSC